MFFQGMGIKVVTGIQYLGGSIGSRAMQATWLVYQVRGWEEGEEVDGGGTMEFS